MVGNRNFQNASMNYVWSLLAHRLDFACRFVLDANYGYDVDEITGVDIPRL
jgi:hypothetical protein